VGWTVEPRFQEQSIEPSPLKTVSYPLNLLKGNQIFLRQG
jgi:hypothetical protein